MSPIGRVIVILIVAFAGSAILLLSDRRKTDFNYLVFLSIAFPFIDLHFSVGKLNITPYLIVSLTYIILRFKKFSWFTLRTPMIMLIGIMVITTVFSHFKIVSALTIVHRLLLLTPIAASYSIFLKRKVSKTLFYLILPPILFTLFFAIIQIIIDPSFSLYYSVWDKEERLSFCYRDPQVAGCAIATFIILLFNLYLSSKRFSYLILIVLLFLVGCMTGSKTFLLGAGLAIVLSLLRSKFSIRNIISIVVCILALSSIYFFEPELSVFQRMTKMEDSLEMRRYAYWHSAWEIYLDNPVFGIGPGSFQSYAERYDLPMVHEINGEYIYASQPESGYLLWLDEYGIFSLVLITLLIYVFSRKGVTSLNYCALIPWAVCFVSLYNIQYTHISTLLTIIIGALFAVNKRVSLYSAYKR